MENNHGSFSSNLGFVLAAMGSAIGLGNLWGFPYKMGANGGFPFLIIYLTFVIFCGVVVMCIEMAIGRKTGKSPVLAMSQLGKKYAFVGWFGVLSATIIMGFYSVPPTQYGGYTDTILGCYPRQCWRFSSRGVLLHLYPSTKRRLEAVLSSSTTPMTTSLTTSLP